MCAGLWNDEVNSGIPLISHHFKVRTYKIYSTISEYVVCYTLLVPTGPVSHSRSLKILHPPGFVSLASVATCLGASVLLSRASESRQGRDKIILAYSVPVFSVSWEIRPETPLMPTERRHPHTLCQLRCWRRFSPESLFSK